MSAPDGALRRQAEALRRARMARGWTQLSLVSAVESAARALGRERDLPPGGRATLMAYISYFENGRRAVPERLRPLFREVYQAADGQLGFMNSMVPPVPEAATLPTELDVPAGPAAIEALRGMLAANIEADMRMGPAFLLPAIRSQLPLIEGLCHQARGSHRVATLRLGIQFIEFCGWLYQDCGDCGTAMNCTNVALDLAAELDDARVISYVLMRKSNIATDAGEAGHAAGLANAALARGQLLTPRLRAVALRQKANAHALLAERDEFERARDTAHVEAAAGMSQDEDDAAPYCTPSYVEMEAGASLVRLGRPADALPIFEESRSRWPAGNMRDRLLCLARLASAYACAGETEAACATASEALASARDVTSARVSAELARLRQHLAPWADQRAVADLRARLATTSPVTNAVPARMEGAP